MINPELTLSDFISPGHLFPVAAKKGGLLERKGHTEAGVSLCKWAGLSEAALICEMVNEDGTMCSNEDAKKFAEKNNLSYCTVEELLEYQNRMYSNVEKIVTSQIKYRLRII